MLAAEILKACKAQGVTLQVLEVNRLKVRAPKGRVDENLLNSIKDQKNDLIRLLTGGAFFDHHMDTAVHELNHLGISLMDFPQATRHRAFILEGELTEAANSGDRDRFSDLLEKWRKCFH